jgi:hypothetical protein
MHVGHGLQKRPVACRAQMPERHRVPSSEVQRDPFDKAQKP